STLAIIVLLLILCCTGRPSSWFLVVLKKLISASLWQSSLLLINASFAAIVGAVTEHGVPIGTLRLSRFSFSRMPSNEKKKKALSFRIGPPAVPPNCSRRKPLSGLPSEVFAVSAFSRWKRSEEHTSELQSR